MPGEGGAAITVLYLARVMADLVLADETCRTSAAFADAHVAALGFRGETCETLLRERMLPAIARHARYLPRHVQERLPGLAP
jgi:hypothetical protein